jgi:hypothetical protein
MNSNVYWYVLAAVAVLAIIGYLLVRRARVPSARSVDLPTGALPRGWQFYSNPTTLEPPGTIFRIDPDKQRYIVESLPVTISSGEEALGKVEESITANTNVVARFLGLANVEADVGAQKTEQFVYEVTSPVMEIVSDVELEKTLPAFIEKHNFRQGHRYFVIRQARRVSAMRYRLTKKQIDNFGGKASVGEQLSAQGKVFSVDNSGQYILEENFKSPMRIVFLPEEIRTITASLAGAKPQMGLVAVREVLSWEDPPDDQKVQP